jgi:hypothetical protein
MGIELVGARATIFPIINGVLERSSFSVSADAIMVVERERTGNLSVDPRNDVCWAPKFDADPLADTYDGRTCAPLVGFQDLTQYDCYTERFLTYPPEGNGAQVETVRTNLTKAGSNFVVSIIYELPSASFVKATYNNTEHTAGIPYSTWYRKDTLKISYEFSGWEWSSAPLGTFLSFYSNLSFSVAPGILKSYDFGTTAGFNWTRADGQWTIFMDIDQSTVLDGVPFVEHNSTIDDPLPLNLEERVVLNIISGTRACDDIINWSSLALDPFLGIIFNGDRNIEDPSEPGNVGGLSNGGKIAIGVSFGVIAAISLTIVLLVIFVPKVKYAILPHSKRADGHEELRVASNSWKPTAAPSAISNI